MEFAFWVEVVAEFKMLEFVFWCKFIAEFTFKFIAFCEFVPLLSAFFTLIFKFASGLKVFEFVLKFIIVNPF